MSNTDLHPEVFFYDFWISLGCIWEAFGVICWVQNASNNYVFFECILHAVWVEGWRHLGGKSPGGWKVTGRFLGSGGGLQEREAKVLGPDC